MKLFIITPQYLPTKSKLSDYMSVLCQHFKWKSDVDPYIITTSVKDSPITQVTDDGIYIYRIIDNWGIVEIKKILNLINKEDPEVIHIQYNKELYPKHLLINFLPFIVKKIKKNIIIVTTLENFDKDKEKSLNEVKKIIKNSDIILVNTKDDEEYIKSKLPEFQNKIRVIYNRSHIIYNLNLNVNRDEVKKRLKLSKDGFLLTFFGFINRNKNLEILFRAAREVLDNKYDVKLLIIGDPEANTNKEANEKYLDDLKKLAEALNLEQDIYWAGYCSAKDISLSLLSSDLAVLPFRDGISGRCSSFWTALEHSVPTITTYDSTKVLPDGLQNKENVQLVSLFNVDELTEVIIKFINDPELCKQIGKKGKELIERKYSWEILVREHVDIYRSFRD